MPQELVAHTAAAAAVKAVLQLPLPVTVLMGQSVSFTPATRDHSHQRA